MNLSTFEDIFTLHCSEVTTWQQQQQQYCEKSNIIESCLLVVLMSCLATN